MKAVNLLPHDEAAGRSFGRLDPLVLGGVVLTVAVVAGTAGGFLLEHTHAGSEQQQLGSLQVRLAAAQAREQHRQQQIAHAKADIVPTPSVTSQEKPWRDAVASALSTRLAFDRVLQEFERVVPPDVTLTNMTMGAPNSSASSGTTGGSTPGLGQFSLAGTTYSEDGVARLLSRLMLVPDLSDVALQSSTADPKTGIVTFEVMAQVKGAAVPASAVTDTTATTTTSGGTSS